jgi:Uma2 family endonuclease
MRRSLNNLAGLDTDMTLAQKHKKWTIEEFLAWHELQDEKYELVDGIPVLKWPQVQVAGEAGAGPMMLSGVNRRHNKVRAQLFRLLSNQLAGTGCDAYASTAAIRTGPDGIRYPDLIVDCGTPADDGYVFENPRLVVEILSPATKSFDLTGKIAEYWLLDGLPYILIIDPEERRAQLHTRQTGDVHAIDRFAAADAIIDLPELGLSIPLAELFEGLPGAADKRGEG